MLNFAGKVYSFRNQQISHPMNCLQQKNSLIVSIFNFLSNQLCSIIKCETKYPVTFTLSMKTITNFHQSLCFFKKRKRISSSLKKGQKNEILDKADYIYSTALLLTNQKREHNSCANLAVSAPLSKAPLATHNKYHTSHFF